MTPFASYERHGHGHGPDYLPGPVDIVGFQCTCRSPYWGGEQNSAIEAASSLENAAQVLEKPPSKSKKKGPGSRSASPNAKMHKKGF